MPHCFQRNAGLRRSLGKPGERGGKSQPLLSWVFFLTGSRTCWKPENEGAALWRGLGLGSQHGLQVLQGQEHPQPWDISQEESAGSGTPQSQSMNSGLLPAIPRQGTHSPGPSVTQHKLLGVSAGYQ